MRSSRDGRSGPGIHRPATSCPGGERSTVYAAGDFGSIGGQSRGRIAASMRTRHQQCDGVESMPTIRCILAVSGSTSTPAADSTPSAASRVATLLRSMERQHRNATAWNPAASDGMTVRHSWSTARRWPWAARSSSAPAAKQHRRVDATINTNNATAPGSGTDGRICAFAVNGSAVCVAGASAWPAGRRAPAWRPWMRP